jgi:hypothetical protein
MIDSSTKNGPPVTRGENGGFLRPAPWIVRAGFRVLSSAAPAIGERAAAWLFCRPFHSRTLPSEEAVLRSGEPFRLRAAGFDLAAWSWGDGPVVVLHHGWHGSAAHMAAFVRPLVGSGFRVVAYDAPAHGESPGRTSAAPELARALSAVAAALGGLHGVVAHSVGGAATMLAVRTGLKLDGAESYWLLRPICGATSISSEITSG